MGDATCSIIDCVKPAHCRGWCRAHYTRWTRHGSPNIDNTHAQTPAIDRFLAKLDVGGVCWEWTGSVAPNGYGRFGLNERKTVSAHRFAYEQLVGAIPAGLELDHLCRNRSCVNPDHLEPVTPQINTLRSSGITATNGRKTHCVQAHALEGDNLLLYTTPAGKQRRICLACRALNNEKERARYAAAKVR